MGKLVVLRFFIRDVEFNYRHKTVAKLCFVPFLKIKLFLMGLIL